MSDDPQNDSPEQDPPESDGFSDFDPDAYLKQRGGLLAPRPDNRAETGAMRFDSRRTSTIRRTATADDPLLQVGDSVTSVISDDTPDTLLTVIRELGPLARVAVAVVGCLAAAILVGLCVFIAVVTVQLLSR